MPRRKGRALTRADVVACAIQCIEAEGASALGVNRVARALNIKPPSLYNHVRGNADLQQAVAIEAWRLLGAHLAAAPGAGSPLRQLATAYRRWAADHPGLYAVMSDTLLDPASPTFAPVSAAVLKLFDPIVAGLSASDAIHTVRAIRAALHGFVLLERAGQFRLDVSPDETFEWLIGTLTRRG